MSAATESRAGLRLAGAWIGPNEPSVAPPGERPAYWLRAEFELSLAEPDLLRLSAQGLVELFVNGVRVGDELLPGYMQYDRRLPVRDVELGGSLRPGMNAIAVLIADGWFRGQTGALRAADQFGTATCVAIDLLGERSEQPLTSDAWRFAASHVLAADLIAGQVEDRRLFDAAVLQPGFDDATWQPVRVHPSPSVDLVGYGAPPVRAVETRSPVAVTRIDGGAYVVDLGQNINGRVRLGDLGPAGTEISLTHGEWLGPDGDVTTDNLIVDFAFLPEPLPAGQIDRVVSAGRRDDAFEPRLTTHGFRYVRVEGHPGPLTPDDVTGIVVHSDVPRIGWFECDDDRINRLHDAVVWSLRGNLCEIPTDCPHRERLGWTGDWQIFAPTAAFLYDVESFTRKWLADVRLVQRDDGMILNHAPSTPAEGLAGPAAGLHGSAGWGDVIVMAPWALYEAYGDPAVLAENWDAMARWVEYAAQCAAEHRSPARAAANLAAVPHERYLWDTGFHWGEWLEPGVEIEDFGAFVAADKGEVATAYLARSAATLGRVARALGLDDSVRHRCQELADRVREAWCHEYVGSDGVLAVQTQASHVRSLAFGLVPERQRRAVADRLADLVRADGTRVGTGFLSTGSLLPALADNGHLDLAYDLLLQPNAPGWMHMIDRGATTVWEHWDGVDADGTPRDSLNHYSKGAVASFLHRYVAGLTPTAAGYRSFDVRPRPGGGIAHVSQRLETRSGPIRIEWKVSGGRFELEVDVAEGTTAQVALPSGEEIRDVTEGRHRWTTRL